VGRWSLFLTFIEGWKWKCLRKNITNTNKNGMLIECPAVSLMETYEAKGNCNQSPDRNEIG
jgi:hypothetical protein